MENNGEFNKEHKEGLYKAIYARRDIRGQFTDKPIPEQTLSRILQAAHHAPSVGFMQPWNFVLIRSLELRKQIHSSFRRANKEAEEMFDGDKQAMYRKFKLEGILESPLNICITCDKDRFGPVVIGRTSNLDMDMFSVVCSVQNLWLAARAEGLGVGWVSILHNSDVKEILGLPESVEPVAYLCIGYVTHFPTLPELEAAGWLPRLNLGELVYDNLWGRECLTEWPELHKEINIKYGEKNDI